MATLVHQCPHCLTEQVAFALVAVTHAPGRRDEVRGFAHLQCQACAMPAVAEVGSSAASTVLPPNAAEYPQSLHLLGFRVVQVWPPIPKPRIPEHVPDQVGRAYLSAERNFAQKDMEEASAGSYGRALDVGTKLFAPDLASITLYSRIKKLAEQHRITADLAEWAHAIRLIRNDALHEIDSIDRDQLVAIRGFTETVLTYLFTLPGMLKARQAETKEKPRG